MTREESFACVINAFLKELNEGRMSQEQFKKAVDDFVATARN